MPKLPHKIKIYRRIRYRKGYGVHSPFVYNLITKVIEEKAPYYIFDEIEKIRRELSGGNAVVADAKMILEKEIRHRKYGELLFRIVNFFKCKNVLHVGAGTGLMTYYLVSSQSDCTCRAFEEDETLIEMARNNAKRIGLNGIRFEKCTYDKDIIPILSSDQRFDLIFLDTVCDPGLVEKISVKCLEISNEDMILIIDGINKNKYLRTIWERIKSDSRTSVCLDLYHLGIVFFNRNIHKQSYKVFFDYGKKQNIYPFRRRRINLFSRREKGTQNQCPDRSLRHG